MSSSLWTFFTVSEQDNMHAIGKTCCTKVQREGKRSLNTTNRIRELWSIKSSIVAVGIKVMNFCLKYKCEGISYLVSIGHEEQLYVILERD